MFMAAAKALAELSPAAKDRNGRLLPPVTQLREVSLAVAKAVGKQAQADGLAPRRHDNDLQERILARVWEPNYQPYLATR